MKESIHSLIMMEMDKKMKMKMKETLQLLCNKLKVSMVQIQWSWGINKNKAVLVRDGQLYHSEKLTEVFDLVSESEASLC